MPVHLDANCRRTACNAHAPPFGFSLDHRAMHPCRGVCMYVLSKRPYRVCSCVGTQDLLARRVFGLAQRNTHVRSVCSCWGSWTALLVPRRVIRKGAHQNPSTLRPRGKLARRRYGTGHRKVCADRCSRCRGHHPSDDKGGSPSVRRAGEMLR